MAIAQDEAIAAHPLGMARSALHQLSPQQMSHGSTTHGSAWVATLGRLNLVNAESPIRVDAFVGKQIALSHDDD